MRLRPGAFDSSDGSSEHGGQPGSDPPSGADLAGRDRSLPRQYRVPRKMPLVKGLAAAGFGLTAVILHADPTQLVVASLAAIALAGYALRDWRLPVRLAADADGLLVPSGFAGQRRLAWAEIERIQLDGRNRFGRRSDLLEIDAGSTLHLFSAYDLGVAPAEAAEELIGWHAAATNR